MSSRLPIEPKVLAEFCGRHRIRRLSVFGSFIRDDFGPESDIDVLVEFDADARVGYITFAGIEIELSELLGRKVDLHTPKGLSPSLREEILSEAEVAYVAS